MRRSRTPAQSMIERRATVRREVDLPARINVAPQPWITCRVRNISQFGAMVELERPAVLPSRFRLQIPQDLFEVECELRHQSGTVAGMLFISNRGGAVARYG